MKKIKLTESQLTEIISQVLTEAYGGGIIQEGDIPCYIWCKRKYAKRGSRGDVVKMIQHLLARGCGDFGPYNPDKSGGGMNEGCAENWTNCDGKFEKETKKAVEDYQRDANMYSKKGLQVDGQVGYNTLSALCELCYKPTVFPDDFTLCDKQCKCETIKDEQGDNGIQDVIDRIDEITEGDPDINDWWDLDGQEENCERIKACLYYTVNVSPAPQWINFIKCMMGDWGYSQR